MSAVNVLRAGGRWAPPRTSVLVLLGLACLAAIAASVALALTSGHLRHPGVQVLLIDSIVLAFVAAGLVAWRRRPDSRFGPLMVAAGFLTFLSTLQWAHNTFLYTLGQLVDLLVAAVFLHVFLAFPTGLLARWPERILVLSGYVAAVGLQVLKLLLGSDPINLLKIVNAPTIALAIERFQLVLLSLTCVLAVGLLAIRRRGSRTLRRPIALLIDAFSIALAMLAVLFVAALLDWPAFQEIRFATFAVLAAAPVAFLGALLDARLAQARVGALLVELRSRPAPNLREALRRALRDPSLTLAYWLPDFDSWTDDQGRPVTPPDQTVGRATAFISRDREPVAALLFDPALEDERELVDAITAAAAIALENDRLQVDLRARVQELQESRARMLEAGEKERQRLERNLHDGAQQRLVALSLELGLLEANAGSDPTLSARLGRARNEVAVSLEELRDVARGIFPAVLSGHGLEVALESLAIRAPVPFQLSIALQGRLAPSVEAAAYYVVCESLANVGKHAHATSGLIRVSQTTALLVVEVVDDGVGGADTEKGSGLRGLADRVEALGGQLRIWTASDRGTRVKAEIPCG